VTPPLAKEKSPDTQHSDEQPPVTQTPEGVKYLENGVIRVGVNLRKGGSITHLSEAADGRNIVNSYDCPFLREQGYRFSTSKFS